MYRKILKGRAERVSQKECGQGCPDTGYEGGIIPVSYTHLDVYKRQGLQIRDGFESPELGFAVAPAFRGRGYAEEACRAVMEYSCRELGFEEIRAVVRRENKKSQKLCEKLGFSVDSETGYSDGMWIFYRKQQILQNFTKE